MLNSKLIVLFLTFYLVYARNHSLLYAPAMIFLYQIFFLGIYGGNMLGVRSVSGLAFYDWETTDLLRRIEITPKSVSAIKANKSAAHCIKTLRWIFPVFVHPD